MPAISTRSSKHSLIELALARHLLGEPTTANRKELRWGKHGSFSVVLVGAKAGVWRDHETGDAGGMLDLIMRERHCDFADAVKFGREFIGGHFVQQPPRPQPRCAVQEQPPDTIEAARRIWRESVDPRGSIVERYLTLRGLPLFQELANDVIRYHAALRFEGRKVPGMVSLMRDIHSNEGCGIIRAFLNPDGSKIKRMMLGQAGDAAVKLDSDQDVIQGLHIGEGVETCIAGMVAGYRPVWATGSAGGIAKFQVLGGIDALTILGENDDANPKAVKEVAARWHQADREVFVIDPPTDCKDLNNVLLRRAS